MSEHNCESSKVNPHLTWKFLDGLQREDLQIAAETGRVTLRLSDGSQLTILPTHFLKMRCSADDFLAALDILGVLAVDGEFVALGVVHPRQFRIIGDHAEAVAAGFPVLRADEAARALAIGGQA